MFELILHWLVHVCLHRSMFLKTCANLLYPGISRCQQKGKGKSKAGCLSQTSPLRTVCWSPIFFLPLSTSSKLRPKIKLALGLTVRSPPSQLWVNISCAQTFKTLWNSFMNLVFHGHEPWFNTFWQMKWKKPEHLNLNILSLIGINFASFRNVLANGHLQF